MTRRLKTEELRKWLLDAFETDTLNADVSEVLGLFDAALAEAREQGRASGGFDLFEAALVDAAEKDGATRE